MKPLLILSPIHRASRQIGLYLEEKTRALGVTNSEGHLLTYLGSYAPCPIAELNQVFGMKPSTMTSMLDRLEERGLVKREVNPRDRRSWMTSLTSDGKKTARQLRKIVEVLENEVLGALDKKALDGFTQLVETIGKITGVGVRPDFSSRSTS